jgi:hypothetical protein
LEKLWCSFAEEREREEKKMNKKSFRDATVALHIRRATVANPKFTVVVKSLMLA